MNFYENDARDARWKQSVGDIGMDYDDLKINHEWIGELSMDNLYYIWNEDLSVVISLPLDLFVYESSFFFINNNKMLGKLRIENADTQTYMMQKGREKKTTE